MLSHPNKHLDKILDFFLFIAQLSCLLLEDDDIRYHSQKFLLNAYIALANRY